MKRIGLMGPFGFGNLGDAATQQAVIENLRRRSPQLEILGFSLNPSDTEERHGIKCFPVGRMASHGWLQPAGNAASLEWLYRQLDRAYHSNIPLLGKLATHVLVVAIEGAGIITAFRSLKGLDHFLVSGGGQLDDYWGGPWYHPYTLLLWSLLAKLRGVKLSVVSVGAGPIDHSLSRRFIKMALALAADRSFRDQRSKDLLASIGFQRDDPVFPDLAHSLDISRYDGSSIRRSERTLVGVGPMAYFDPRVWPERDQHIYESYLSKLAELVAWLLENENDVLLFTGEAEHDRQVISDLRAIMAERGISKTDERIIELPIVSVDDLMTQLAATDLIIASRFHGVLLPQLLDKPVLALSYHEKIDCLMEEMGQADYCLPIDRFTVDGAKARFAAMQTNAAAIKSQMSAKTEQYRATLDAQYQRLFQD